MKEQENSFRELYDRLREYAASDFYPWHMPGHKRRLVEFVNPFSVDITEIEGFDDLHHPDGILKEAMEEAADIYGAEKTYFLVNGSSCGILAAISAAVKPGGKLLMARNCHKSAYHGALLQQAQIIYVYPELEKEGFYGVLRPEAVEAALEADPEICAVMMVSPGYEGVVSDVKAIADIAHAHGCALLIDEAHGAHLPFGKSCGLEFPASALEKGADVVIQSLHKTLPSLTQTALLHLGKGGSTYVESEMLEFYLRIYQSSSPSYVFMASIDHCIRLMAGETGKQLMRDYAGNLRAAREYLHRRLKILRLYEPETLYDPSKFVILCGNADGSWLADRLRSHYHLEPEMHTDRYVILMSSPADTEEGFVRLTQALAEIDRMLGDEDGLRRYGRQKEVPEGKLPDRAPKALVKPAFACTAPGRWIPFSQAAGKICRDFIYIYPPGIPLLVPGEQIEKQHLELIDTWLAHNLEVHGISPAECGCQFIRIMI